VSGENPLSWVFDLAIGLDGKLYMAQELDQQVSVFSAEGVADIPIGRSNVRPWFPRLRILHATRDMLWALSLGALDEPYVHRFDVDRQCQ